jgi:ribonucleoside-diphosphate reductase alpha chain
MKIVKRNGKIENLSFDKILLRLKKLTIDKGLPVIENIDTDIVSQKVIEQIYDGISSTELDDLAGNIANTMSLENPGYGALASRIAVSNIQKNTPTTFHKAMEILHKAGIINDTFHKTCVKFRKEIQDTVDNIRDYDFDYFGIKTLERSYLLRKDRVIIERPQYMYMRVAVALYPDSIEDIRRCYDGLSKKLFTHASPTLFNAGTMRQQCSSCYILSTEDSIGGIYKSIADCAHISKFAGGIGISVSNIRSKGSIIKSTNGHSDGIVPMLKVYNETARYVNQSSRRNGSFAIYLEPHHPEIFDFLDMKKNTGDVNLRARDLFYGLWVSDLFMRKVESDEDWYLMCPNKAGGLDEVYGEEYEKLYEKYVEDKKYSRVVKARELWNAILVSQTETGLPYMCYKDNVNSKSNQKHLGVIKSSNLCVAPETKILTSTGYHEIASLENKEVQVWNGEEFTKTVVRKTGVNVELIKVVLENGSVLECTKYHKFYTEDFLPVKASDLRKGQILMKCEFPVIDGTETMEEPYKRGYYHSKYRPRYREGSTVLIHKRLKYELELVPVNYSLDTKLRWLEGFLDRNAKVNNIECLEIFTDVCFLESLKYLLNTLGCNSVIFDTYLLIKPIYIHKLYSLGLRTKHVSLERVMKSKIKYKEFTTVMSVVDTSRKDDTFCFTETKKGLGVFNGILTGQCAEISLYNTPNSTAVCNIATISLNKFVEDGVYNYERLGDTCKTLVRNLNRVIDINYYPTKETEHNNKEHRPIAIGVQGLYNLFMELRCPFDSEKAKELNKNIFECIQYSCISESNRLAELEGPYNSYKGSPISEGIFQHNMWGVDESTLKYDWKELRNKVKATGVRNSLLTALPPTASTSQILGNVESFEVLTSNLYTRKVLAGNYPIVNKYLVSDLMKLNLWNTKIKDAITIDNGSIQNIEEIPEELKQLYKTTWEISQKTTISMSADRAPFIDHSQSLNIFMASPTVAKLSSMHFYGWKLGLKTGMYYLRSLPASSAEKFSVSSEKELVCSLDNKEECEMCSG